MAGFGDLVKGVKSMSAVFNAGTVKGLIDEDVELIEIEPLHTTINGESIIILVEPVDLVVQNRIKISMGDQSGLYGRADGVPKYKGTSRSISLRFKMVKSYILNGPEAVSSNTMTANLLQQMIYPAYMTTAKQDTSVIKTPPFFRILYGDLIGDFKGGQRRGLTGYISNLAVSIGAAGQAGTGGNLTYGIADTVLPIVYDVNLEFTAIHDHVVGWYDGKFAQDGRNNWPHNTGIVVDQTPDGPGNIGGNSQGDPASVPGSPAELTANAAQTNGVKMNHKNNSNDMNKGKS